MIDNCCKRNFESMESHLKNKDSKERIKILKKFKKNPSIDIGCGGFMPFVLNTTDACDKSKLSEKYLKQLGWKGNFKQVDARKKLSYLDKQFKTAICSETIEHFRKESEVTNLFKEIDRISKNWIVTTPIVYYQDKDHHLFFGSGTIYNCIPFNRDKFVVLQKGKIVYVSNYLNLKELLNG